MAVLQGRQHDDRGMQLQTCQPKAAAKAMLLHLLAIDALALHRLAIIPTGFHANHSPFPQVDFVKLLHDKLMSLSLQRADTPEEWRFPRPSFKVRSMVVTMHCLQ